MFEYILTHAQMQLVFLFRFVFGQKRDGLRNCEECLHRMCARVVEFDHRLDASIRMHGEAQSDDGLDAMMDVAIHFIHV